MKRLLAGIVLAVLVILGLPWVASAGQNDPYFSVPSTSYSGQPSKFSVRIINNVENSTLSASVSGAASGSMSCVSAGAIGGLGPYKCTLGGSYRLNPGTLTVTARSTKSGKTVGSTTHSATVSSRFGISGHTNPTEGDTFSVSGRYDHISGQSDFSVHARVSGSGGTVAGQSSTSCSASNGSYRCSLKSAKGSGSSYTVTVTESRGGFSRSASTGVSVAVTSAPQTPVITSASSYDTKNVPTSVFGTAGRAGLRIEVAVDSGTSFASPTSTCTSSGANGFWTCSLPKLTVGKHTIAARSIDPTDPTKISPVAFQTTTIVKKAGHKPKPTATPTPTATESPVAEPPVVQVPPVVTPPVVKKAFDGLSHQFSELLALLILALAVTALARPGTVSAATGGRSVTFADENDAIAGFELSQRRGIGIGDNSPSWRAFGHDATDYWSRTMPGLLNRYSPFLARLSVDGIDLRAAFGALWWLFPFTGAALGLVAINQVSGPALAPKVGVLVGVMVISAFDAFAGFVASVVFGVLLLGDVLTDKHTALTVLAVGFLWTSLPLVATSIRPFRRPGVLSLRYGWDRVADLLITSLLCGWIAQKIAQSMDLFAGRDTGIPAHANAIGLAAVAAIAVRVLFSQAVEVWWPERLRQTEVQEDLPETALWAVLGGMFVRVFVFAFLGHAFIGGCWQWYLGVLLFALPDLLLLARDYFGLAWQVKVPLPVGVTHIFLVVVACTLLVAFSVSSTDSQSAALRWAFLAAALVPAGLAAARVFRDDEDGEQHEGSSWDMQLAGAGILLTTVILAVHGWNF
ncbi:hypothetical protein [Nocardioides marmorisolisilvae]|uniref:Bacterial Ig-like domain-containing protein n=1 Tax=Nocardioides marmorisolisilvae TaxID=1542737 RepID=A0A3N0DJE0_9ACTN|nr:hypothetical protein [Nocardioides marmorisolisilvae]RNL75353.1 hypothetical protein EFL95_18195 [Nocardioides marmorisolisilvae]